jgi:hypothetical protein
MPGAGLRGKPEPAGCDIRKGLEREIMGVEGKPMGACLEGCVKGPT